MTLQRLNEHLNMVLELQEATEILSALSVNKAPNYDGMPHAHQVSRTTENIAIALRTHINKVATLEKMVKASETEVREFIDTIEDSRTRIIFDLHFLCGMKWEAVARMIGGGNTKDSVRMACYRYLHIDPEEDVQK